MSGVEAPTRPDDTDLRDTTTPPDRPEPVIRTSRLTKKYDALTAVNRLDLEVFPGEIFGLLGQNGAGKTTTILMLLGLSEPTSGEAWVMGLDPAWEPREVKRRVGYLPDAVGFYGGMSGRQNLRYTAKLNGIGKREAEAAIDEVLVQVGLADRADDPVETYSRGMKQRLGIADALVKAPDLLILDEPTTSIDPLGVVEILDLLRRLTDERGIAILLSSHLLSQVQSVCDRIGIFASGRLVGIGTVEELARTFGDGTAVIEVGLELSSAPDIERAGTTLRGLRSVESVEPPSHAGGAWRVHVRPADEEGRVRQDILVAAVEQGLGLTALRPIVPSLDDIYRVAVERPIPKRSGVKAKGKRRRDAAAAAAGTSAAETPGSAAPEAEVSDAGVIETTQEDEA
jgi:ABC-2 type transport system ATP-binding protein